MGTVRNYAKSVLFWNLALDQHYGPHDGGCDNCRGVLTILDAANQTVYFNVEYYVLAHASKFVAPGAVRIDSSESSGKIESVAFQNPDGTVVLLAYNPETQPIDLSIQIGDFAYTTSVYQKSLVTFQWKQLSSTEEER